MKNILIISFIFLFFNSEAKKMCLAASQNRIFPIGIINDTVVVFETHLWRSINTEKDKNKDDFDYSSHWRGITYLKKYSKTNKLIISKTIDTLTLFSEELYVETLSKSFNKSIETAITECDLELFEPVSLSFCDYQNKCNSLSVKVDNIKKGLYILLKNKKNKFPVNILKDSSSVASNIVRSNTSFEGYFDEDSSFLDISSIRKFKAGKKSLIITHLGYGQRMASADGTSSFPEGIEYKPKFQFNKLNKSIFIEPVMHHGNGFDFMIFE